MSTRKTITLEMPAASYQRLATGLKERERIISQCSLMTDDEEAICAEAEIDAAVVITKALKAEGSI